MVRTTARTITLVVLSLLFFLQNSSCVDPKYEACAPKTCGEQKIKYPFWIDGVQKPYCGFPGFNLSCDATTNRPILKTSSYDYVIRSIFYNNQSIRVSIVTHPSSNSSSECIPPVKNVTLPFELSKLAPKLTEVYVFTNCSTKVLREKTALYALGKCSAAAENMTGSIMAIFKGNPEVGFVSGVCTNVVSMPVELYGNESSNGGLGDWRRYEEVVQRGFVLKWKVADCKVCDRSGGLCGFEEDSLHFQCYCPDRPHYKQCFPVAPSSSKNRSSKIWAGIGGSAVVILVICSVAFVFWYCYRKKYASSNLFFVKPSDPSSESSLGRDSAYFGVPVFAYGELELATNHFDSAKELGDGGFGTVYYGKLRDGREVAVKRLYENNYKRVEQFINEINILTRLRHQNLVTLYGCTSRRSRELLLVYEFIPNGTVADHLHGDRSTSCLLTWPVRLRIATETASALAYLHASDIIHRDVKTHNILLDINFCVKVADFGLSRLFPTYATHISTAPQGTPGYVDPEYHKCYQLTEKSDVYSFGVVLIELISSMPAVDICRDREEINLSTLAMNRIQNQAYHHLVDPSLGFDSDHEIRRMTILVAELAFQCLQPDKDERPSMDEILRVLRRIQGEQNQEEKLGEADDRLGVLTVRPPASPESEDKVLLKRMHLLSSPTSVTDKWVSTSTTPNVSV